MYSAVRGAQAEGPERPDRVERQGHSRDAALRDGHPGALV